MTINKTQNGSAVTLVIEGRLDTMTSPDLEKELQTITDSKELIIDCAKLDYISSAGLRVLLSAHKAFSAKDGMTVTNVQDAVLDVFDVTGFKEILNIK